MRRGKERWTHADDERLSRALLTVFANRGEPVVLSDNCALWKRVQQHYQDFMTAEPDAIAAVRSVRSLHTRWARGIRPDLILFVSLLHKMQKTGMGTGKAVEQAVRLFREQRSESNALAVRQFVQKRQRTSVASGGDGDSETDSSRPKLRFESFHFLHCYDILCSNSAFLKVLLDQSRMNGGNLSQRKRRQTEAGIELKGESKTSAVRDSCTIETKRVSTLRVPPTTRVEGAEVSSSSSQRIHQHPPTVRHLQASDREMIHSHSAAQPDSSSVVITFNNVNDDFDVSRVECDRAVANEYVRLRMQTLQEDRRLKLLAELRGVVATIAQLAQQLAWDGVASAALAAQTGVACIASNQGVLRDIAFFRHEKQRLKRRIAALDGSLNRDRAVPTDLRQSRQQN